ncbi:conjugal transfer protein TraF [Sulfurimonas sp.]|uniref:conjugal transfer protein TraF n=1 Tax=Sulfurimonas sp. TaxID=2022749 RepID=UPI003D114F54
MKKILTLSLIAFSSVLYADFSQQEFVYKDPRVMGMGSANTAVGGYSSAVFYNPAGLINIKKSHGIEVELLGLSVAASQKMQDFANDLSDAADTENSEDISKVLQDYSGEAFNITVANYSSVSYHTEDDLAWSVGLLASGDINLLPHANSGNAGLLEAHGRAYSGLQLGVAQNFGEVLPGLPGELTIGVGAKFISQKSYDASLDVAEIDANSDDLAQYLQDTYEVDNSGFAVDLGVLYAPFPSDYWNPTIGLSVMNIGTLNFDDAYGAQPLSVNLGVSVSPKTEYADFIIAVDYVDALGSQQALVYDSQSAKYISSDISYEVLRHLRAGVSAQVLDNSWATLTLNGGLYQGAYTMGVDFQLTVLKLQAATYQEQLGGEMGQLEDRRYVVGLGIGW